MIIQPAERISVVEEYYFSKKLKEIRELNEQGKDIINLGIGSPDLAPLDACINTLCEEAKNPNNHAYQMYVGIPELRNAFSVWYKNYFNVELNPANEILPLIGSKEGIIHISMAFVNKGDKVLVPNPGYPTYSSVSKLVEADIVSYDLDENNNWEPNFEKLEKEDLENVKIMWVNYPNMPTGAKASLELFKKLVAFGKKHKILIVNDNPYSFVLNNEQLSILSVEGAKDVCIELNSLSKSHNMAGWRIGMVGGNKDYIEAILRVKSNVDSGTFKPMQLAAVHALNLEKDWYESINIEYDERRKLVWKLFDSIGCKYDKKQVGMFVWAKIPTEIENASELSDKYLYHANVFLTPGLIFGNKGDKYLRISLCAKHEKIKEAIERIKAIQ
jgi:aspartate/methionine/tyrosine aminotransferase